jgi:hypothetical protein
MVWVCTVSKEVAWCNRKVWKPEWTSSMAPWAKRLAVMVDTFKPLMLTEEAMKIADETYYQSWL